MEEEKRCYFQCSYVHDLSVQKEFSKGAVYASGLNRFLNLAVIIALVLFYPLMVFGLDSAEAYSQGVLSLSSFYLVIGVIRMFSHRGGGIGYKRMLFSNGGTPPQCDIRFLDDRIVQVRDSGEIQNSFLFDQVKCILETENLYLLGMKYQLFLIVDKRGLSHGCFPEFLLSRCTGLKKKKILNVQRCQRIERIKYIVILLSILLSILHHPSLQLKERLSGQIHNGMTYTQIAAELEEFGITGASDDLLADLDTLAMPVFVTGDTKLTSLLYTIGVGTYDIDTYSWHPPTGGVYLFSYASTTAEGMYTDLLENLTSMTGSKLSITNIRETLSADGSFIHIEFLLNDVPFSTDAVSFGEWFDKDVLNNINSQLSDTGDQMYFAENDEYSCFIFYGDDPWAEGFAERTGLKLVTDIYELS